MHRAILPTLPLVLCASFLVACSDDDDTSVQAPPGGGGTSASGGAGGSSTSTAGTGAGAGGSDVGGSGGAAGGAGGAGGSVASGGAPCVGFFDALDGQSSGVVTGGSFTADGWKVTTNGNTIFWHDQRISSEGILEFDVNGLGGNQECGGGGESSAGKCRLWWLGANDQAQPQQSEWSATGRTIADNFFEPQYIDMVRLGVTWLSNSPKWSDTAFAWDPATWYHMTVTWDCQGLYWHRSTGGGSDQLLVEMLAKNGNDDCYEPENDPNASGNAMSFMIGGGVFGAKGATFKNVEYTPIVCSDVLPSN